METIELKEYLLAYERIKPFIIKTPVEKIGNNLFLKKESMQTTNSFKWSGVLYAVIKVFDNFITNPRINFKIVTQSTGNHGIATIRAVKVLREYFVKKYPQYQKELQSISPIIFTNKHIIDNKLNIMKSEMASYDNNGFIDVKYNNYQESLEAREDYIKNNDSVYIAHGGKDIMTGYGAIAFHLNNQLPKNQPINFYCAVGAGGPIGIGLCLKYLRKTNFNIVQTKNFDSFIKSIQENRIILNPEPTDILVSDGIAVDKPEKFALNVGKRIIDNMTIVNEKDVFELKNKYNYGGSTLISMLGYLKSNTSTGINIILDCEGN